MTNASTKQLVDIPQPAAEQEQPDAHGKFSLSEDWLATIAGLALLILCFAGIVPNIGEWF